VGGGCNRTLAPPPLPRLPRPPFTHSTSLLDPESPRAPVTSAPALGPVQPNLRARDRLRLLPHEDGQTDGRTGDGGRGGSRGGSRIEIRWMKNHRRGQTYLSDWTPQTTNNPRMHHCTTCISIVRRRRPFLAGAVSPGSIIRLLASPRRRYRYRARDSYSSVRPHHIIYP
jgi:hypothetical protein